jgi:hypothetical protein
MTADMATPLTPLNPAYVQWIPGLGWRPRVAGGATETDEDSGDSTDADTGDADTDTGKDTSDDTGSDQADKADPDEVAKWKALARKHEKAAKANATKLAEHEKAAMSDTEKAVADAKDQGRNEVRAEVGAKLAQARIEAALAKLVDDPAAIAEDLNLSAYVTDDGDVDEDKVQALKAKYERLLKPGKATGDGDGGPRGGSKPGQLSRDDIKSMSPQEITKAKADGRLNDLMGVK